MKSKAAFFDCFPLSTDNEDDENEEEEDKKEKTAIIAASFSGGAILIIGVALVIWSHRKKHDT